MQQGAVGQSTALPRGDIATLLWAFPKRLEQLNPNLLKWVMTWAGINHIPAVGNSEQLKAGILIGAGRRWWGTASEE